ncbi:hypothetical protein [Butyrivibrio sp. XPD2006]|uniref:hypothetical protein n=1 Tax=Butyrivibrio sp. XPD2006 TaxID=1280668 RepID=UPI0012DF5D5E|nr:hypothetical protein [Butyrivibrio sp. XPD2006]
MNSNNEEYLDSLLNSAQKSNSNNPQSALSRMSSMHNTSGSQSGSGDISALVNNSNGNQDLDEIGSLLSKLDSDEIVDDKLAALLDDIEEPTDPGIPKFRVGDAPSIEDVRDPEEIALDEAIADAERMDAEMQSGKFDGMPANTGAPLVDTSEGDDALLEMAPEVSLPEDNQVVLENEAGSDADQTPEEILTDLLDDMPDGGLTNPEGEALQESLSDVLDNMKDEADEEPAPDLSIDMPEEAPQETAEQITETSSAEDDINLDELSLDDLESQMDEIAGSGEAQEAASEAAPEADVSGAVTEDAIEELDMSGFTMDGGEPEEHDTNGSDQAPADEASAEAAEDAPPIEIPLDSFLESDEQGEAEKKEETSESLDAISEEDFNLESLEASLDNLLGSEEGDSGSTEGEVAALAEVAEENAASGDEAGGDEVSMQDLDALMNSLANDEIEDIESTAAQDEETGHAEESEIPKEDILDALTEDGFGDEGAGEPSLDELASIPEKGADESDDGDEAPAKGKKKKGKKEGKEKKPGLLARLFQALTKEDEETENEGLASLTDENQQVLDELGEGGAPKGKKKKEKKEKKPKEKKPKKEKPPKEKKPPKPKKEKKPKPPKDPGVPEKAISPKKIAISGIFAASLGILVMIPALVLPDRIASERAETAYTHKEYTTAYKMLYGKDMNENETVIYEQSRVLAWAQRYLDGYDNYTAMNMKEEALDMLLMAKRNKSKLLEEAEKYSVEIEVNSVYDSIESLLAESYGLSEADVEEINSIKKDRDYTIRLMEIVGTFES